MNKFTGTNKINESSTLSLVTTSPEDEVVGI